MTFVTSQSIHFQPIVLLPLCPEADPQQMVQDFAVAFELSLCAAFGARLLTYWRSWEALIGKLAKSAERHRVHGLSRQYGTGHRDNLFHME